MEYTARAGEECFGAGVCDAGWLPAPDFSALGQFRFLAYAAESRVKLLFAIGGGGCSSVWKVVVGGVFLLIADNWGPTCTIYF